MGLWGVYSPAAIVSSYGAQFVVFGWFIVNISIPLLC